MPSEVESAVIANYVPAFESDRGRVEQAAKTNSVGENVSLRVEFPQLIAMSQYRFLSQSLVATGITSRHVGSVQWLQLFQYSGGPTKLSRLELMLPGAVVTVPPFHSVVSFIVASLDKLTLEARRERLCHLELAYNMLFEISQNNLIAYMMVRSRLRSHRFIGAEIRESRLEPILRLAYSSLISQEK